MARGSVFLAHGGWRRCILWRTAVLLGEGRRRDGGRRGLRLWYLPCRVCRRRCLFLRRLCCGVWRGQCLFLRRLRCGVWRGQCLFLRRLRCGVCRGQYLILWRLCRDVCRGRCLFLWCLRCGTVCACVRWGGARSGCWRCRSRQGGRSLRRCRCVRCGRCAVAFPVCGGSRWLYGRRRDVRPRFVCLFFCLPRGLWHLFRCLLQWRCGGRCSRSGLLGRCQILFHEARVVRRHEQRGDEDEEAELPIVVAREKGREDGEHHSDAAGEDAREGERPALDEEAAGVREPTGEKEPKRHDASCHEKIRHAIAPFRYDDGGSRFPRAGDARRCAARYATF